MQLVAFWNGTLGGKIGDRKNFFESLEFVVQHQVQHWYQVEHQHQPRHQHQVEYQRQDQPKQHQGWAGLLLALRKDIKQ